MLVVLPHVAYICEQNLQNDVDLIHEIEAVLGKQLEKFECNENEVLSEITKVRLIFIYC